MQGNTAAAAMVALYNNPCW